MNDTEVKTPVVEPPLEPESTPNVEPVIVPTPAPVVQSTDPIIAKPEANTPGVIILQWLSYAFWGWLILALIWLIGVILANAILGTSVPEIVPYAIAAGVVLLPIAFLTDFFYRKHEPAKKTGVAMVIMVIHAVLFALLAIVSLIVTVFNSLNALIETSNSIDERLVIIFTALTATLLYAATFIRVLNPFKANRPVVVYSAAMATLTLVFIALAIVGPLVQALTTKDDRRIEQNLPSISQGVNDYVQTNEKLPADLSDITFSNDQATLLVEDGLVRYSAQKSVVNGYSVEHRYQLCVTFKEKDTSGYTSYTSNSANNDYPNYLSVSGHAKGEVCYKLSETTAQSVRSSDGIKGIDLESTIFN
jgi:hypothetical protein